MTTNEIEEAKKLFITIREYSSYGYAKCVDSAKLTHDGAKRLLTETIKNEIKLVIHHTAELEALLFRLSSGSSEPLEKRKQTETTIRKV